MTAFLKNEYLPASRKTSGIGSLPLERTICYLYQWTTTEMSPRNSCIRLKVARLNAEMEKSKTQVGFQGTYLNFDYVKKQTRVKTIQKTRRSHC
jgi:uncharacterized protein (DUF885 family)